MTTPDGIQSLEPDAKPRTSQRLSIVVCTAFVTAAAVLTGLQVLKPAQPEPVRMLTAGAATDDSPGKLTCTVPLSVTATGMKSETTPVEITIAAQDMGCTDPSTKEQIQGHFSMPGKTEGTGNCHKFDIPSATIAIDWKKGDDTSQKSTIALTKFSWDDQGIPAIEKSEVTGYLAGSKVNPFVDPDVIGEAMDAIKIQCKPGEEQKKISYVGQFKFQLVPPTQG